MFVAGDAEGAASAAAMQPEAAGAGDSDSDLLRQWSTPHGPTEHHVCQPCAAIEGNAARSQLGPNGTTPKHDLYELVDKR